MSSITKLSNQLRTFVAFMYFWLCSFIGVVKALALFILWFTFAVSQCKNPLSFAHFIWCREYIYLRVFGFLLGAQTSPRTYRTVTKNILCTATERVLCANNCHQFSFNRHRLLSDIIKAMPWKCDRQWRAATRTEASWHICFWVVCSKYLWWLLNDKTFVP